MMNLLHCMVLDMMVHIQKVIKWIFHGENISMKFNLFDFWEFEIDWKAVIGIGLLVIGYALLKM